MYAGINLFWSIKNSTEVLGKLQNNRCLVSTVSIYMYDFSTLYTTLPHNLIKDKLTKLIQKTFAREKKKIWLVMLIVLSLLMSKWSITHSGLVSKFVIHSIFFLISVRYGILYTVRLSEFLWVQIVHHSSQTYFCIAMREISCWALIPILKQMSSYYLHSIILFDT